MVKTKIRWVLTVPALWSEEHKHFMREAAKNAGIIEENNSEKLIQNPREDYTKQLVNAASPGWLNKIIK